MCCGTPRTRIPASSACIWPALTTARAPGAPRARYRSRRRAPTISSPHSRPAATVMCGSPGWTTAAASIPEPTIRAPAGTSTTGRPRTVAQRGPPRRSSRSTSPATHTSTRPRRTDSPNRMAITSSWTATVQVRPMPSGARARATSARATSGTQRAGSGSAFSQQRFVEEADHAPLVFLRPGDDPAGVRGLRDLPALLQLSCSRVVLRIELLLFAADSMGGIDEEDRARGDPPDQVLEVRRRRLVREEGRARRDHRVGRYVQPGLFLDDLANRARARAFGHESLEVIRFGGRLQHHLPADGEPDAADPVSIDVGTTLEERRRRGDVFVERPTVRVRLAVTLSLTAPVEEQHAVPMPHEHAGVLLRASPAGEGNDSRTVPRRHIPPVEREPVARRERHLLVRRTEPGRRHAGPCHVREDVRDEEGEHERPAHKDGSCGQQQSAKVAPPEVVVLLASLPERRCSDIHENDPRPECDEARVVVARGADLQRVVDGFGCTDDDSEESEENGKRPSEAGADAAIYRGSQQEHGQRDEATHQMIAGRHAALGLEEVVVDDV